MNCTIELNEYEPIELNEYEPIKLKEFWSINWLNRDE